MASAAAPSALSMAAASLIPATSVLDPCFLVEKPPDDYICQVCMNILRQPTSGWLPAFTHFVFFTQIRASTPLTHFVREQVPRRSLLLQGMLRQGHPEHHQQQIVPIVPLLYQRNETGSLPASREPGGTVTDPLQQRCPR